MVFPIFLPVQLLLGSSWVRAACPLCSCWPSWPSQALTKLGSRELFWCQPLLDLHLQGIHLQGCVDLLVPLRICYTCVKTLVE